MATDDLIDEGNEDSKGDPKGPAPVAAPTAADIQKAVAEGMGAFAGEMKNLPGQIGQYVQQAISQANKAVAQGNANQQQTDLTQRLLTEPEVAITELMNGWAQKNLGPYLATQVEDKYSTLVEEQRKDVDSEYGDGVFDELILGELESVIEATPNKEAKGSKRYIKTVTEGILGNKLIRPKLAAKLMEKKESERKAELESPTVLDGGRRKPAKGVLDPESIRHLAKYEEVTGKSVDRKLMEEALNVRNRDGGWNIDNFPGLK